MLRSFLTLSLLSSFWLPCHGYFSQGWQPGQPVTKFLTPISTTTAESALPTDPGTAPVKSHSWKDFKLGLEDMLTSGPVSSVLMRFGFNISEKLALAREGVPPRFVHEIPLITDSNYEDMIHNEDFTSLEEEKNRVWAILVSVGSQDPVSHFFDQTFDGAHNLTVQAGDADNIRWGRVDYLDVTDITTRWVIWRAPVLVIATDRGLTLRFFKIGALSRMKSPEEMRHFVISREWEQTASWSGPWSPRGSRAGFLAKYAKMSTMIYTYLNSIPRWLLLLVTATTASALIQFLHANDAEEAKARKKITNAKEKDREKQEEDPQNSKGKTSVVKTDNPPTKRKGRK
ncbi:uncharacterized protein EI90DRAFT_3147377 [Cantharellus anzutake]|uniref:uncharacterized protein n=1 Tax=Cantharellus anzutake TaxID=1750568 RepID=UPI001903854F|nr:uncharacterized protein EI90DRAFT_3147377 [Cantharellus anzutake]KAF8317011.1 hypothetical protein EI90DRAFT_3147377 [Cantharellus anzutake]